MPTTKAKRSSPIEVGISDEEIWKIAHKVRTTALEYTELPVTLRPKIKNGAYWRQISKAVDKITITLNKELYSKWAVSSFTFVLQSFYQTIRSGKMDQETAQNKMGTFLLNVLEGQFKLSPLSEEKLVALRKILFMTKEEICNSDEKGISELVSQKTRDCLVYLGLMMKHGKDAGRSMAKPIKIGRALQAHKRITRGSKAESPKKNKYYHGLRVEIGDKAETFHKAESAMNNLWITVSEEYPNLADLLLLPQGVVAKMRLSTPVSIAFKEAMKAKAAFFAADHHVGLTGSAEILFNADEDDKKVYGFAFDDNAFKKASLIDVLLLFGI